MDSVRLTYAVPVLIGLVLLVAFPLTRHMTGERDRRVYWILQGFTVIGAVLGAKLSVAFGDYLWPLRPIPGGWQAALSSGRSITGGLLGGLAFAEIGKPLLGYALPPNDRFAVVLPFSIAMGRVGCILTGCCLGLPHVGALSVEDAAGVARWPAAHAELLFHVAIGLTFVLLLRRGLLPGRLFALYLLLYGTFRFGLEFVRDTPKWFGPLSGYQLISIAMASVGAGLLAWRRVIVPVVEVQHA